MSGKYALIIGNTEYIDPGLAQLTAPGKDAEDFSRVLKEQDICAFDEVKVLLNQISSTVIEAVDEFFDQKKPDDLLVLYFSGHGVRDELGALYLAVRNTIRTRLRSTAIKSEYIREAMDQSRSKRQVLIMDCCNSGAFAQGTKSATGISIGTATAFEAGYGRIILTASDSTQYAWEGDTVIGETDNSLFTHFLVEGLEGEADLDGDGSITVDELYDYAYEKVKLATPKQTPSKFSSKQQGEIIIRQNMRIEDIKPVTLPPALLDSLENPFSDVRLGAVQQLIKLLYGKNLGLARSAREALERIAEEDDSRTVSRAAFQAVETIRQTEQLALQKAEEERLAAERKAKEESERLLAEQRAEEERKAKKEAKRLAALQAKEELLAREIAEADRVGKQKAEEERQARAEAKLKAKQEAERLAMKKAARFAKQRADIEPEVKRLDESKTSSLWGASEGLLLLTLEGHTELVEDMAFTPDGQTLASGSDDATVRLWHVGDGTLIRILYKGNPDAWVSSIAFSPGGQLVASSSSHNNTIHLWRVSNGILVQTFEADILGVNDVSFSPDGKTLASGSSDRTIRIWRVSDGALVQTLTGKRSLLRALTRKLDGVNSVTFSPSGKMLASGSDDNTVRLWDVNDGTLFNILRGHTDSVLSVSFSPDGKRLASGSADNTIRLWHVSDGTLLQTLVGHTSWPDHITFSPDGKILASSSGNDPMRLWRVSDGKLLRTLGGPTGGVSSFAFSPTGQILASGSSEDGRIFLWGTKS